MIQFEALKKEFLKRWEAFQDGKIFAEYLPSKSRYQIFQEFEKLQNEREELRLKDSAYAHAEDLFKNGNFRCENCLAFAYNNVPFAFNASLITLYDYFFLAMEGPSHINLPNFFQVLDSFYIQSLVRLTPDFEGEILKCHPYWKDSSRLLEDKEHFQIMNFYLPTESGARLVTYYVMENWPDNGAISAEILLNFIQEVRKGPQSLACHCSAGVGRTGTFIAAYLLISLLEENPSFSNVSIEKLVYQLSLQRPFMVASKEQYFSLYELCDLYFSKKII